MKKSEILSIALFLSLILIIIIDSYLVLSTQVLIAPDLDIYFDTSGLIVRTYIIVNGISIIYFGFLTDKIEKKI